jgi:hypothetical protein
MREYAFDLGADAPTFVVMWGPARFALNAPTPRGSPRQNLMAAFLLWQISLFY